MPPSVLDEEEISGNRSAEQAYKVKWQLQDLGMSHRSLTTPYSAG